MGGIRGSLKGFGRSFDGGFEGLGWGFYGALKWDFGGVLREFRGALKVVSFQGTLLIRLFWGLKGGFFFLIGRIFAEDFWNYCKSMLS